MNRNGIRYINDVFVVSDHTKNLLGWYILEFSRTFTPWLWYWILGKWIYNIFYCFVICYILIWNMIKFSGKLWCNQLLPSMARTQLPLKNKVFLFHQQLFRKLDMTIHNIITANYHNDFYIIIPINICIYFLKTGLKHYLLLIRKSANEETPV